MTEPRDAERALAQIEPVAAPGWPPAESVLRQLQWLALTRGEGMDAAPGAFSMELIAAREFDMYGNQPELALLINEVQAVERAV